MYDLTPAVMCDVEITVISHKDQRYETCGDWYFDEAGKLYIRVSRLGDWRYEQLIAIHELAEVMWCIKHGVTTKQVDEFDFAYEASRKPGDTTSEPGDDPKAPYYEGHQLAIEIERQMADKLGVDWDAYGKAVEALFEE